MLPTITRNDSSAPVGYRSRFLPEIDDLFPGFLRSPLGEWDGWIPSADLTESEEEFVLQMELPGFTRSDVEITVDNGVLTVSGERSVQEEDEVSYHLRERGTRQFRRSFMLPRSVNQDDVRANLQDGVLTVELPKAAEARPRRIEVKAG